MTMPSVFARMAAARGTVAVVSDPHEIANVMGEEGINYILEDSRKAPMKIFWGTLLCAGHAIRISRSSTRYNNCGPFVSKG
jgi:adenine deaminase